MPGRWSGWKEWTRSSWTRPALSPRAGPASPASRRRADAWRLEGQTVAFLAVDRRLAGLVGVSDPIRPTTPEALRDLRENGVRVVMVTGDHRATAEAVARRLGIEEVHAEILPAQKA